MYREPIQIISSQALALTKHWLDQPSSVAESELLFRDPPSWIVDPRVTVAPAICFNIMNSNGAISPEVIVDPSGFAIVLLLTALGEACMIDHRSDGGRPYVKVFSGEPSSGISLRRILSGAPEGENARALENPLDYRASVTGVQKGSRRDKLDQSDAIAIALKRYGPNVPQTLAFRSYKDYEALLLRAFERHWEHQDTGVPTSNAA